MFTTRFASSFLLAENFSCRYINQFYKGRNVCHFSSNLNLTCNVVRFVHSNNHFSQIQHDISLDNKPSTKILKIAIIGTPNAGKSTFINQIVGRRVFAMSKKVHTTRGTARAVLNLDETQVIFVDTPGLVTLSESDKYQLDTAFIRGGELSITEANIIGVMHDVSNSLTRGRLDPKVLRLLHLYPSKHSVLILNKVDIVKKKRYLLELVDRLTCNNLANTTDLKPCLKRIGEEDLMKEVKRQSGWPHFNQVFMVSALEGSGVGEVMEYLLQFSKPGKWMFPNNVFTDKKPEDVILEVVKGRMLEHLPHEVPYKCKLQMELYNELRDGTIMAVVMITCPKIRIEKMAMKRIRTIAQETEAELRSAFMTQVLVKLVLQTCDD